MQPFLNLPPLQTEEADARGACSSVMRAILPQRGLLALAMAKCQSPQSSDDFVNSFPCGACRYRRDGQGNKTQGEGEREKGLALSDCAGAGTEPNMLGRKEEAGPLPPAPTSPSRILPTLQPRLSRPPPRLHFHHGAARHSTNVFFLFSLNIWSAREVISIRQMALFLFRATQPSAGSGQGSAVLLFCRRWAGANV